MDMNPFEKLGETVRRASDDAADPQQTVKVAKDKALAKWNRRASGATGSTISTMMKKRVGFVAVFAAAVAAFLYYRMPPSGQMVTYTVGPDEAKAPLGAWIAAGPNGTPLRFSEGTLVTLQPGARARVTGADAHGATLSVERGHAYAKVVHVGQTTSWLVHAGPFDVNVVGTEFDVAWDPTQEVFDIHVDEGKVIVRGPHLDGPRAVSASEVLRVDVHNKSTEVGGEPRQTKHADNADPKEASSANEDGQDHKAPTAAADSAMVPWDKPLPLPTWQKLANEGKHKEALEAAEQAGFEQILATASANTLLELADEARFAGSADRAKQAILRARELGARGRSAYLLGKLAADNYHAPADAITWFQRYLEESPSGSLAEQALGRIVELEDEQGHREAARKAAQTYLQRYPGGAYESLARRVSAP